MRKTILGILLIALPGAWSFLNWLVTAITRPWLTPQAIMIAVIGGIVFVTGFLLLTSEYIPKKYIDVFLSFESLKKIGIDQGKKESPRRKSRRIISKMWKRKSEFTLYLPVALIYLVGLGSVTFSLSGYFGISAGFLSPFLSSSFRLVQEIYLPLHSFALDKLFVLAIIVGTGFIWIPLVMRRRAHNDE